MEFGVLFTSHPNPQEEPYPHRAVHARTTEEVIEAERRKNAAASEIDIARWVYIADTDAQARAETEEAIVKHIAHFGGTGTREKAMKSLKLFAERVIPAFRPPARKAVAAE